MIAFRRWKRNSYSEFFRVIEVDGLDHPVPITRRTSIEPGRGSGGFKLVAADLTVAVIKGGRHIVIPSGRGYISPATWTQWPAAGLDKETTVRIPGH